MAADIRAMTLSANIMYITIMKLWKNIRLSVGAWMGLGVEEWKGNFCEINNTLIKYEKYMAVFSD